MPICRRDRSNRARKPSSASCSSSCRRRASSAGVELVLPRHRQRLALGVVVEAGKPDERRLALRRRRRDLPDEPAALPDERDPARLEKGFHRRPSTRRPSPPRSSIIRSTSPTGPSWARTGDGGSVGIGWHSRASYQARASSSLAWTRSARTPAMSAAAAGPRQGVLDERLAQAASLLGSVDREAGEEHHGNRMPGQPLAAPSRRVGAFHRSRREPVTGKHRRSPAGDVGADALGFLVGQRKVLREAVERLLPAREELDVMGRVELLDRGQAALRSHSSTPFPARSRAKRGLSATGRSRTSWKASHRSSSSRNVRRSAKGSSAVSIPASSRNSVTVLRDETAACRSNALTFGVVRTSMQYGRIRARSCRRRP